MKVSADCIPCFLKQLLELSRLVYKKKDLRYGIIKRCISVLSGLPLKEMKPPQVAKRLYSFIREESGVEDPFREIKKRSNQIAKMITEELRSVVEESDDPFETALRLSIAGNIIDYGQAKGVDDSSIRESIEESLRVELDRNLIGRLYKEIEDSKSLLYIADNAGEIFFDRLFIENMPTRNITFAVRERPIINDATREDAIETGIDKICTLIDTGDDTPGIILEDCSEEFVSAFNEADVIISKGQGNFETLSDVEGKRIYFLFKIKCIPVAEETSNRLGSTVVLCRG